MSTYKVVATLGVLLHVAGMPIAAVAQKRVFTQRDSIELTRIANIDGRLNSRPGAKVALYSPGGERFIVRTQRGDLARDENIEQLLLFETRDVLAALSSGPEFVRPAPRKIAEFAFHDDAAQIAGLHWIDDETLGYIAKRGSDVSQAFTLDVATGKQEQLTQSAGEVVSFAVAGDRVLYYAARPVTKSSATVIQSNGRGLGELLEDSYRSDYLINLYSRSRESGAVAEVSSPPTPWLVNKIWLSPDGFHAITLTPATNAPAHWSQYRTRDPANSWTADWVRSDPMSMDLAPRTRYQLVDLRSGQARPIFDAPDGMLSGGRPSHDVFWLDNERVILVNTYLPFQQRGLSSTQRRERLLAPAIAEVSIADGHVRPILWVPFSTVAEISKQGYGENIIDVEWDRITKSLTVTRADRHRITRRERWTRHLSGPWTSTKQASPQRQMPLVERHETTHQRPKLFATGGACACAREIHDVAPNLDQFALGRQEIFRWNDSAGRAWSGGLIYPTDYQSGNRYPLVLQTHGYYENEFQIDGYHNATTAFAAQALANSGFIVLQDGPPSSGNGADEIAQMTDGYKAAIDALDAKGLIDRNRIGIIGFSRTGLYVAHLLATYPDLVQAATIADAVQYNYVGHLLAANFSFEQYRNDYKRLTGGVPGEIDLGEWINKNPFYRMSRSNAALRVEAIGPAVQLFAMWETYASYSQAGAPADLVYFPQGSHVLLKPSERYASQGGNVDWFRFWLQDVEDPDPAKTQQYLHWRKLREQQKSRAAEQRPNS